MQNGVTPDKKFLDVQDLASYLSCSVSKVYKMVEARKIPFGYIPGTRLIRFPKKEIDDWMTRDMVKPV